MFCPQKDPAVLCGTNGKEGLDLWNSNWVSHQDIWLQAQLLQGIQLQLPCANGQRKTKILPLQQFSRMPNVLQPKSARIKKQWVSAYMSLTCIYLTILPPSLDRQSRQTMTTGLFLPLGCRKQSKALQIPLFLHQLHPHSVLMIQWTVQHLIHA